MQENFENFLRLLDLCEDLTEATKEYLNRFTDDVSIETNENYNGDTLHICDAFNEDGECLCTLEFNESTGLVICTYQYWQAIILGGGLNENRLKET